MGEDRRHRPFTRPEKGLTWLTYCKCCGLIWLKNERTARAIRAPCPGREDD